jgi:hypothetical protein
MDEGRPAERIVSASLSACVDETIAVGTLRYFDRAGALAETLRAMTGAALPGRLAAQELAGGQLILAWRGPTETLCLSRSAAHLAELIGGLAAAADGYALDLTGGLRIVRLTGARSADLICRLGGAASVPAVGEARRSRMADVAVLALSVRDGETLLAVDRAHLPHLFGWIRETLLDFESSEAS